MERFVYHCLMRPAGLGAVPRDGLIDTTFDESVSPSGHHTWGTVTYNRKLSDAEIHNYELEEDIAHE